MSRILKLVFGLLLAGLILPAIALAGPPPPSGGGGGGFGGSPEPLSALLLALGSVPTYLVYRRVRAKNRSRVVQG